MVICILLQFFFVLRKKYDQVTTLHVIHHGIMPLSVWFGVKFTPGETTPVMNKWAIFFRFFFFQLCYLLLGGHSTFFGLLNTFVHIIMYAYYMAAAFGPQMQKYLWWKKYLTALQMVITFKEIKLLTKFTKLLTFDLFCRCNSLWYSSTPSNFYSSTATTRKLSFSGLECTPLCSTSCSPISTNRLTSRNKE